MRINRKAKILLKSERAHKLLILRSVAGFAWRIVVVSIAYFSYKTTTSVKFAFPSTWSHQAATLCVRYRDVLDRGRIASETGIRLSLWTSWAPNSSEAKNEDQKEKLTIEQIFKYTPDTGKLIRKCVPPDMHGPADPKKECYRYFSKHFTHEYIGYTFRVKQRGREAGGGRSKSSICQVRASTSSYYRSRTSQVVTEKILFMAMCSRSRCYALIMKRFNRRECKSVCTR